MATQAQDGQQDEEQDRPNKEAANLHNVPKFAEEVQQTFNACLFRLAPVNIGKQEVEVKLGLHIAPAGAVEHLLQEDDGEGGGVGEVVPAQAVLGIDSQVVIGVRVVGEAHPLHGLQLVVAVALLVVEVTLAALPQCLIGVLHGLPDGVNGGVGGIAFRLQVSGIFYHEGRQHNEDDKIDEHGDRVADDKLILLPDEPIDA